MYESSLALPSKHASAGQVSRIAETFTVDALVSFVERKLQTANA